MKQPVVLSIAGSDCSGGAGLQADLKTITAAGCYGATVPTALTAQNTVGVQGIFPVPEDFFRLQLESVFSDFSVDAVKIGMIADETQIRIIRQIIEQYAPKYVVLDPVLVSTTGSALLQQSARKELAEQLFSLATLVTPNLSETKFYCDIEVTDRTSQEQAARTLEAQYGTSFLVKGGHIDCVDVLIEHGVISTYSGIKLNNKDTHGTGCVLSSAIASYLARGENLSAAVEYGKSYVTKCINHALHLGHGNGPMAII